MSQNLETYFTETFLPQWLQSCNAGVLQRYRAALDWLTVFLKREPTLDDLTNEQIDRFCDWLIETKRAALMVNPARSYGSRLKHIRRHVISKSTIVRRDMTVKEFLKEVYGVDRALTHHSMGNYRVAITYFGKFIGSEPMLSELTEANVAAWTEKMKAKGDRGKAMVEILEAIWNFAFDLGYVSTGPHRMNYEATARIVTTGDSLRQLMTAKYFPANWAIRSDDTKKQYKYAMNGFAEYLGHEPTLDDLTDEALIGMMHMMVEKKLAPKTVNERAGRIRTLWNWLAKKAMVPTFPTVGRMHEEVKSPKAWTKEELTRLFEAARTMPGAIGSSPAKWWWTALLMTLWNTGERIGGTMSIERDWIDRESNLLHIPANVRKGGRKEAFFSLWPDTVAAIEKLLETHDDKKVFPFKTTCTTFYQRYRTLLRRAGLEPNRENGPHKMRRSFATWLNVAGGNDSKALGHSNSNVTEKSYRDPRIIGATPIVLFKPWEKDSTGGAA